MTDAHLLKITHYLNENIYVLFRLIGSELRMTRIGLQEKWWVNVESLFPGVLRAKQI